VTDDGEEFKNDRARKESGRDSPGETGTTQTGPLHKWRSLCHSLTLAAVCQSQTTPLASVPFFLHSSSTQLYGFMLPFC